MLGEQLSRPLHHLDQSFRKLAFLEGLGQQRRQFKPECIATLRVNARVADDGEVALTRGDEEQDAVALASVRHVELVELCLRVGHRVGGLLVRDADANLTGRESLRFRDRAQDLLLLQAKEKPPVIHGVNEE